MLDVLVVVKVAKQKVRYHVTKWMLSAALQGGSTWGWVLDYILTSLGVPGIGNDSAFSWSSLGGTCISSPCTLMIRYRLRTFAKYATILSVQLFPCLGRWVDHDAVKLSLLTLKLIPLYKVFLAILKRDMRMAFDVDDQNPRQAAWAMTYSPFAVNPFKP